MALLPTMAMSLASSFGTTRTMTDAIHRSIELHPLETAIIDTPEFQRLRGVSQLGACRWVYPGAVHDRFQHSLGVAHLARTWTEHFQRSQPELLITDADVLCVTLAGLLHDLGHGPLSHFWEGVFLPLAASKHGGGAVVEHEELSCALIERMLARNDIDASAWLEPEDWQFVKALICGGPPAAFTTGAADDGEKEEEEVAAARRVLRLGEKGVVGSDKRFLYEVVANGRSGFDVDKLDYFERDCHFAGVVKVSFDRPRLMAQARVALACDEGEGGSTYGGGDGDARRRDDESGKSGRSGQLQICWPVKCLYELLQVFQTRFHLHSELYQHRVTAAVTLMLADALVNE